MPTTKVAQRIDVRGETCPVPVVEARRAFRSMEPGDEVEITGDHSPSKSEITMALDPLGLELLSLEEEGETWTLRVKKE